jgi:hypothetical protein
MEEFPLGESPGTKKLGELKCFCVAVKSGKESDEYHIVDFIDIFGTKCGYPINQFMRCHFDTPPEGKTLCRDCEEGNLDWSRKL